MPPRKLYPKLWERTYKRPLEMGRSSSTTVRNRQKAAADSQGFLISHFLNCVIISPCNHLGRKLTTECESFRVASADECLSAAWFMPSNPQEGGSQGDVGVPGTSHHTCPLVYRALASRLCSGHPCHDSPSWVLPIGPFKSSPRRSKTHPVAPSFSTDLPCTLQTAWLKATSLTHTSSWQKQTHVALETIRSTSAMPAS